MMGVYINPDGMTKEEWLEQNGKSLSGCPDWNDVEEGELPVCLVNNGPFTAAAVAYCPEELNEFADPSDPRPKKWFMVSNSADLEAVCGQPIPLQ